ncbi:ubiquitin carboxyl-terminal hydrolase 15-like isoform X1 [Homarus americanus]|uniref:ubiquitin carboxyl-terminal hydrolase 15-like isoform X1 n=1 Tax=Homarus americanus TaxID=6706 RepID=UPI001C447C16|nr:ubiquitin carboxyl-terminal hydrolase 15-like isoform X1 [Homarus americanus]XP_042226968.1 ubiquitin carboxyl-terminal hydrolase 15-like isoform X1 [Homarus americanus]XP_042226969.1 ubiquitin carboxyl-terminal hydrolase 15-like isoform X1 [Homarus americanus]XP_042226970.1 ubiquitin carboxyl-terminal hydrolase 15-like isoform X1 [Homarus americanus]
MYKMKGNFYPPMGGWLDGDDDDSNWEQYKRWASIWLEKEPSINEKWYFVKSDWLSSFRMWLNSDKEDPEPGPIDISGILGPDDDLLGAPHRRDIEAIPENFFQVLSKRFTIKDNETAKFRHVVANKDSSTPKFMVERKLMPVYLAHSRDCMKWDPYKISREDRIFEIEKYLRTHFEIDRLLPVRNHHYWCEEQDIWECLTNKHEKADQIYDVDGRPRVFMVEPQNPDGTWPLDMPRLPSQPQKRVGTKIMGRWGYETLDKIRGGCVGKHGSHPGLISFQSYQNSCYMTSVIVQLAQIPSLRDYYLTDTYLKELNVDNPLGRKGRFAKEFGLLVKHIWKGFFCSINAVRFKKEMAKYNPDYTFCNMNDCHEFLLFLLDGLHEDCNRVVNKPYVELPETAGRPDKELAAEAVEYYKKRNDSHIVDIFSSLIKGTINCGVCGNTSVNFEPTPCLSIPIPIDDFVMRKMSFRALDQTKPMQLFRTPINQLMTLEEIKMKIAKQIGYEPWERLQLGRTKETRLYHNYEDEPNPVVKMFGREGHLPICVLETPPPPGDESLVDVRIDITVPNVDSKKAWTNWMWGETSRFFVPFFVRIQKTATYDQVYEAIMEGFGDRIVIPPESDEWWVWQSPEDDKEEEEIRKTYCTYPSSVYTKTDLTNKKNRWTKNGKHYLFRMYKKAAFDEGLPNHDKAQEVFMNGEPLTLEFHPLYARKYLIDKIYQTPNATESVNWKYADPPRATKSLYECLDEFHKNEKLDSLNSWFCSSCKDHTDSFKSSGFWSVPNYLIIHLKRFMFKPPSEATVRINGSVNRDDKKINSLVTFPEFGLDLDPYMIDPDHVKGSAMYDLIGLINHDGKTSRAGHYLSFVKYTEDQYWYSFNDDMIQPADPCMLQTRGAYLLLFKRRGVEDLKFTEPEGGATEPENPAPSDDEMEKPKESFSGRTQRYMTSPLSMAIDRPSQGMGMPSFLEMNPNEFSEDLLEMYEPDFTPMSRYEKY